VRGERWLRGRKPSPPSLRRRAVWLSSNARRDAPRRSTILACRSCTMDRSHDHTLSKRPISRERSPSPNADWSFEALAKEGLPAVLKTKRGESKNNDRE